MFRKKFGNARARTLSFKLTKWKLELKRKSQKLKYEKKLTCRKFVNKKLETNPKHVQYLMNGWNIITTKIREKAILNNLGKTSRMSRQKSTKTQQVFWN